MKQPQCNTNELLISDNCLKLKLFYHQQNHRLQACGSRQQGDAQLRRQPVPEQALPRRGRRQPIRGTRR